MRGLMQDWPLLCHRIIEHAATFHEGLGWKAGVGARLFEVLGHASFGEQHAKVRERIHTLSDRVLERHARSVPPRGFEGVAVRLVKTSTARLPAVESAHGAFDRTQRPVVSGADRHQALSAP